MSVRDFFRELFTPTVMETDNDAQRRYKRLVVAVAHAALGAGAMIILVPVAGLPASLALAVVAILYLAKELLDYRKSKDWRDGVVDMASTMMGAVYYSNPFLPILMLILGAWVYIFHKK